jgi:hypothetical protein
VSDPSLPSTDHGPPSTDLVRCRADHAYPGRPLEVFWEREWLPVLRIMDEYITPIGKTYRVVSEGERHFLLEYDLARDCWAVGMVELP